MLKIEITASTALVYEIKDKKFVGRIEDLVRRKIGSPSFVVISENASEKEKEVVWIQGVLFPDCDGETEIPDEKYLCLLDEVGKLIYEEQSRFSKLNVRTSFEFQGGKPKQTNRPKNFVEEGPYPLPITKIDSDTTKRFNIWINGKLVNSCDSQDEVVEVLSKLVGPIYSIVVEEWGKQVSLQPFLSKKHESTWRKERNEI